MYYRDKIEGIAKAARYATVEIFYFDMPVTNFMLKISVDNVENNRPNKCLLTHLKNIVKSIDNNFSELY